MKLKLPAEKVIARRYLSHQNDFVHAHYCALRHAHDANQLSGRYSKASLWQDLADCINRNHQRIRAAYDKEMLEYLEAHDWNVEYYCDPGNFSTSISVDSMNNPDGTRNVLHVPFNYFAAPVVATRSGVTRPNEPVYYNKTVIEDVEPDSLFRANQKHREISRQIPEEDVPSVSRTYNGKKSALVPLILAAIPGVFLWMLRFGSLDGIAMQTALQTAMQQNPLMNILCFIPEKLMSFFNAIVDFTIVRNTHDLELLGPLMMYGLLIAIGCVGIFFSIYRFLNNQRKNIPTKKQWRARKEEVKAIRQRNKTIRAQNAERKKAGDAYLKSPEYLAALRDFEEVKAANRHKRDLAEKWHRAWFEVIRLNWDKIEYPVTPEISPERTLDDLINDIQNGNFRGF